MAERYRPLAEAIGAKSSSHHIVIPCGAMARVLHRNGGGIEIELKEPIAGERRWFVAAGSLRFEEEG